MDLSSAQWKKSSRSGNNGGQCVEVASDLPGIVAVRDSKNPSGPALTFAFHEWTAFLASASTGEFDVRPKPSSAG
jgi:Domain of unknown function (DUF397)